MKKRDEDCVARGRAYAGSHWGPVRSMRSEYGDDWWFGFVGELAAICEGDYTDMGGTPMNATPTPLPSLRDARGRELAECARKYWKTKGDLDHHQLNILAHLENESVGANVAGSESPTPSPSLREGISGWNDLMALISEGYHDFEFGMEEDAETCTLESSGQRVEGTLLNPHALLRMLVEKTKTPPLPKCFTASLNVAGVATAEPGSEPIVGDPDDRVSKTVAGFMMDAIRGEYGIYTTRSLDRTLAILTGLIHEERVLLHTSKTVNTQGSEAPSGGDE